MKRDILAPLSAYASGAIRLAFAGMLMNTVHTCLPFETPCVPKAATPGVDSVWVIADRVQAVVAGANQFIISQALLEANFGYTITQPGRYILCEDVFNNGFGSGGNGGAVIFINSDNVILDLNGYSIQQLGQLTLEAYGIRIASGVSNVVIQNGVINIIENIGDPAVIGIYATSSGNPTDANLVIKDIVIKGNATGSLPPQTAIQLGDTGGTFRAGYLYNVQMHDFTNGVILYNASDCFAGFCGAKNLIADTASIFPNAGFGIISSGTFPAISSDIVLSDCSVINANGNGSTTGIAGFMVYIDSGLDGNNILNVLFDRCTALNVATAQADNVDGFLIHVDQFQFRGIICKDCVALGWANNGFVTNGTSGSSTYSAEFINCFAAGNWANGFSLETQTPSDTGYVIRSCVGLDNTRDPGNFNFNNVMNNMPATAFQGAYNNFSNLLSAQAYNNFNNKVNICFSTFGIGQIIFSNYYHNAYSDANNA